MSEEHKLYLKKHKNRDMSIILVQFGVLILFFVIWELVALFELVDPFITSSPSRIVKTISQLYTDKMLFNHLLATLNETLIGFLLSTIIGSIIAILLWSNSYVRRVAEPYLVILNALPKVALGPLIIIWAGAGKAAIITMTLLICLIITVISMLNGFMSVEKQKIQLLNSMNANKFQILTKLVLPSNVPTLLSVLKINVGLSWVGTIMGEYLVSREGIGYLIVYGSQVFNLDLVMASTLMLCVLATTMYLVVAFIEKICTRK